MLTEELNRWGLAYLWGLMGLPGSLARIMIDRGNLVGDVVSEDFARQANLTGKACWKEIETTAATSKMQIIGRCYPVQLRIVGIGTSFDVQLWIARGMKNAVAGQPGAAVPEPEFSSTDFYGGQGVLAHQGWGGVPRGERVQQDRRTSQLGSGRRRVLGPGSARRERGRLDSSAPPSGVGEAAGSAT